MSRMSVVNNRDGCSEEQDGCSHTKVLSFRRARGKTGDVPQIIEVKGLTMDNDANAVYVIEPEPVMGDSHSKHEDVEKEGQKQPLTTTETNGMSVVQAESKDVTGDSMKTENGDKDRNGNAESKGARMKDDDNDIMPIENEDGSLEKNGQGNNKTKEESDMKITVAGKDDVDAASTYSLFMEKDFRYYFQHPYSRLAIAYTVVFLNFLIYAEDPVAHSRKECSIPLIGNTVAFVLTRYPSNAWSLLKVIFWLIGLVTGLLVGKLLVHGLLFNRVFRLKMFSNDQGSWMIMFLASLVTIFIMSAIYTAFLSIGGEATLPYRISSLLGVGNDIFMKVAACGTWCGDFFTAWMVTDIMLQEKLYPGWARAPRGWWRRGWNRIILFWIVVLVSSFVVIFVIATDYIQWDKLNRDFVPSNEVARAFLASFILVMDLLIVMQDWDFPHFMSAIDIKLPGLNTAHIRFNIPKCLKKDHWKVHITGKWFNYGILFIVMLLDLNMWKNQIFYLPYDYAQYTGPDGRIYTVQDDETLDANETVISYDYRNNVTNPLTNQTYLTGDSVMNSRYYYSHLGVKGIAFIPSLVMFILFGVLIMMFGRFKPTTDDPYAGRLKKRMKKRFSFRLPWKRRDEIKRKIHAVPKLLYFKRKKSSKDGEPEDGFSVNRDTSEIQDEVVSENKDIIEITKQGLAMDKGTTEVPREVRADDNDTVHVHQEGSSVTEENGVKNVD